MTPDYVHLNNLPFDLLTKDNFKMNLTGNESIKSIQVNKNTQNTQNTPTTTNYIDKQWMPYTQKNTLIISMENAVLDRTVTRINKITSELRLKSIIITVLREPRNALASIWKIHENDAKILEFHKNLWIEYAEYILKHSNARVTSTLPGAVCVLYDRWFEDEGYRKCLAAKLGLTFDDSNYDKIFKHGVSSFDGYKYQNNASQMDVLNRFSYFSNDPKFKAVVVDDTYVRSLWNLVLGTNMY